MLIIDHLSIRYKTKQNENQVIQNLSFQLQQGEALVILGPSGCGKSTLINALAGTLPIESGSIDYITEHLRQSLSPKTHKIGLIPQNCGLLPWKTVKENCHLALRIRKEQVNQIQKEEMDQIYKALNIHDILDKYPGELSGGQVQRAAIARAFIMKPDLLLMDEPFSALDEITKEEARELFLRVWSRLKPTTILVTHSIEEALYLGHTIFVMGNTGGEVKYQMKNPYFGNLYPNQVDYLMTKQLLRSKLVKDVKEDAYE
ncbi:MAG: nitrate/sulfonate/bicarbonate transporter ATP-binding protein [Herbinix sp.]|jgi:NitT/TauT family transport system ATP-binding protein|nr:nitrate/sulfonate/bicarbonate transporter ATP-binding protein [Herbinix sp.]